MNARLLRRTGERYQIEFEDGAFWEFSDMQSAVEWLLQNSEQCDCLLLTRISDNATHEGW